MPQLPSSTAEFQHGDARQEARIEANGSDADVQEPLKKKTKTTAEQSAKLIAQHSDADQEDKLEANSSESIPQGPVKKKKKGSGYAAVHRRPWHRVSLG